jgi:microsomal dipeptidase-like Zn-dependent dipeptidase
MMRNRCLWLILGIVSLVSALMAFQRAQVFTNGKETREVLVANNKVYVSVAALREAGAVVSQSGSRLDNEMIEGRVGEWLSNGTWRVRVSKVEPSQNPFGVGQGFAATVEFRNLTKQTISLHGTGFDRFQLQDDKGNKLSVAAGGDYDKVYTEIVQADGITMVLRFGDPNNQLSEVGQPDKLLILFRPWGGEPALPGFRIFLKEKALPSEGKPGENAPLLEGKREGKAPPPEGKPGEKVPPPEGKPGEKVPPPEGKPGENVPPPEGKPGEKVPPSEGKTPPSGANAPPSESNVPPSGPSEEGVRTGQAPNIRGFEPDQVFKGGSFTILGSNFGTQEGKIVVLGGHDISVDLRVISWSDTQIVVELPNDPQVQEGQRYYVGIQRADHTQWLSNIDRTVTIRGTLSPRDDRPRIRPGGSDPSLRTGRAPNITGIEHDGDCVPKAGSLTILGSNFGTREARVTLEGHGMSMDLRIISWSDTRIVAEVPDDSRIRPGLRYDVRIRAASEPPGTVSVWQSNPMPITICVPLLGWADLHAHPASHLAFGGIFHGSPGRGLRDSDPVRDMPECSPDKHAGLDADPVRDELRKRLIRAFDAQTGAHHSRYGPPSYSDWPHSQSLLHQQMHVQMIHRAYLAGLRVMIASVTDNQVVEKLFARTGFKLGDNPVRDPDSSREFDSAVRQIRFIRELVQANSDWMQIVLTPQEARNAIRNNKLAIILGVEMDSLSVDQIVRLIEDYGVRSVIPIHLADNPHFGGAAVYEDAFNTVNWFLNGRFFAVVGDSRLGMRLQWPQWLENMGMGAIAPKPVPLHIYLRTGYDAVGVRDRGVKNSVGLTNPEGIKRLMQKGILLDIAHMSERTTEDVLALAELYNYPLINTHSGLRDREERAASERYMMRQHAARMARLGGVLGFGTEGKGKVTLGDTAGSERRDREGRYWRFGTRQLNQGVLRLFGEEGETDRFVLSVRTGGDNLDSGYGFGVIIRWTDGSELFWDNVNRNEELPGNSVRSFILFTASATRGARDRVDLRNVREVELRSEWHPDDFKNVEWDIMDVRLEAFPISRDPVDTWLQSYRDAMSVVGGGIAFGTDFNGFAPQIPFSRGRVSYPIQVGREVRIAEGLITRDTPFVVPPALSGPFRLGTKSYDFSRDGLAHYGMFPEFLQDLWNRGAEGQEVVRSIFRSAERLIRAWEGAWRAKDRIR